MSKDNAYLADILDSARIIQEHLAGMSREHFLADVRTQDAVIRRFEIIGEAARHLSPAALKALPEVAEVDYVTPDQALATFRERHQNDQLTLQALDELGSNPLGASLEWRAGR